MKMTLMISLLIISNNLIIAQGKLTDTSKTDTSNLSKFLLEENKKHQDPLRPIATHGYKEDKKIHDPAPTRNLDINKYRRYIDNIDPDDPELEKKYHEAKQRELVGYLIAFAILTALILSLIYIKIRVTKSKPLIRN